MVVAIDGTVMVSVPSFAVLARITVGKVLPPSVDRDIFTLAQFTEPVLVLFTSQVMVCEVPLFQVTLVFGAVTLNGPAVLVTVMATSAKAVWPTAAGPGVTGTYGRLSRTVRRKLRVLETELRASMLQMASPPGKVGVINRPACTVERRGK